MEVAPARAFTPEVWMGKLHEPASSKDLRTIN